MTVQPPAGWPVLPRVGLALELPGHLQQLDWFGLGPGEAYPDTTTAVRVGRFASDVADLQTPYVFPQENGNRRAVRWAGITGAGGGFLLLGAPLIDVTLRPWSSAALAQARHPYELMPDGFVHLDVDAAVGGVGTASCGPGVLPAYEVSGPVTLELRVRLLDG